MSLVFGITALFPSTIQADYIVVTPETPKEVVEEKKPIDLIKETFGEKHVMIRIAYAENRPLNPKAKNPKSSASGIYQITKGTWKDTGCMGDVFNAKDNILCAKKLHKKRGTQPWNASKHVWGYN